MIRITLNDYPIKGVHFKLMEVEKVCPLKRWRYSLFSYEGMRCLCTSVELRLQVNKKYRIMAEAIPLNYFKTSFVGVKMYLDEECTMEENYNNDDALYPFYTIKFHDLKLGRTKKIIRYIKNLGDEQVLFVMYQQNGYNIEYKFEDEENGSMEYLSGILLPSRVVKVTMTITPLLEDSHSSIDLYISGRQFAQNR